MTNECFIDQLRGEAVKQVSERGYLAAEVAEWRGVHESAR
ncbi:hypothetical protein ABIC75_004468 [Dyella japonica]|uniref:Transposase n=1 Tax=Dyella japonica TaxID=231455 RepID=A0ABV2K0V8_9GAMM